MATRILVVEDDADVRTLLTYVFSRAGYDVTAVGDGQEALKAIENGTYDVLLTDLNMPVMNGWELTRILNERGHHIPTVVLTASMSWEAVILPVGATTSLAKPFRVGDLLAVVKDLARGNRPLDQS